MVGLLVLLKGPSSVYCAGIRHTFLNSGLATLSAVVFQLRLFQFKFERNLKAAGAKQGLVSHRKAVVHCGFDEMF